MKNERIKEMRLWFIGGDVEELVTKGRWAHYAMYKVFEFCNVLKIRSNHYKS